MFVDSRDLPLMCLMRFFKKVTFSGTRTIEFIGKANPSLAGKSETRLQSFSLLGS
ncbi:hypothetical protein Bca4012_017988 [Brassica carinata]